MSKKLISLLLVLVMLVGCFASCDFLKPNGGNAGTLPGGGGDDTTDDTTCKHEYSAVCDPTCNKCNETREVEHTYENDCDTTCNVCNSARETEHKYSNGCDTTCNVCNAVRTVDPHADPDSDGNCDSCGMPLNCDHAYDNNCDETCNNCGWNREAPHNYSGVCDTTCADCSATRSAAEHNDTANGGFIDTVCDVCGTKLDIELYVPKVSQYNTTTSVMPSNWNELTYADNNDTQIMSYIGSSFFTYDYKFENDKKFNADGSINKAGIVDGAFTTNYSAATKLEDVTASVDAKWGYTDEQKAEGGYAWKITLRDDLQWDDGTPITAADFVYSMQAQLDPNFMNFRGNLYYDTLMIKNSRAYFFQNAPIYSSWLESAGYFDSYGVNSDGYATVTINGEEQVIYTSFSMAVPFFGSNTMNDYFAAGYAAAGYFSVPAVEELDYDNLPAYVEVYEDEETATTYYYVNLYEKYKNAANEFGAIALTPTAVEEFKYLALVFGDENPVAWNEFCLYVSGHGTATSWDSVGMYAIPEENAIVLCLDKTYTFLNEDGSLSVWAPYYMSGLPLVKKDLYESCKKSPAVGATLWTSNYNSSLATTASWGPFKLVEFEAGSHYRLEKNENWYGWYLPTNQNQYNISAIYCEKIEEQMTQWMGFLAGNYDDSSLYDFNVKEYFDSKYVSYSEGSTGTFGMQLYSNLDVLKVSDNNNGILAIQEFRQAINLATDRSNVIETIWPGTATPCFGLVNVAYYYDIENASTLPDGGKYRNSEQAKKGILRAYGYAYDAETDTWSINDMSGLTLEEAYETLTGYNLTLAKQKAQEAINILLADPEHYGYDSTKEITLVYGSSVDNEKQRSRAQYVQGIIDSIVEGTVLEGKIKVEFDASAGNGWADAFRSGQTQIGFGYGFSGNAFNPFDIIGAFVNPDDSLNYHEYWDTSVIDMTLTMPAGEYVGAGEEITMSVQNWYFCLNGLAEVNEQEATYNWSEGFAPTEVRLMILSALEEVVLKESRSIMLIGDSGGSFLGAKFSYFSDRYNTFMGFGGLQYMVVEYTDAEWEAFVAANNDDLTELYKQSE